MVIAHRPRQLHAADDRSGQLGVARAHQARLVDRQKIAAIARDVPGLNRGRGIDSESLPAPVRSHRERQRPARHLGQVMADRGGQAVDRRLGLPRIAPELGCVGSRLDRRGIRSERINLSAIQQRQDPRERREAAVDAFGQLGVDVQERRIGFPSAEDRGLEPQHDARLVRDVREVTVAGEYGTVADQQVRRGAAGDPLDEGGRIVGACVGLTRPLEQERGETVVRRDVEQRVIERQGELVGKRHRLNDGPLLLVRVRELAVAL